MSEIKCPNCGKTFTVSEDDYANISRQVRDSEFKNELEARLHEMEEKNKIKSNAELERISNEKDKEIVELQNRLKNADLEKTTAVKDTASEKEKLIAELEEKLRSAESDKEMAVKVAVSEVEKKNSDRLLELEKNQNNKQSEIESLKSQISKFDMEKKLAVTEAVSIVEKERDELKSRLEISAKEAEIRETGLKENYERELKRKDDDISQLRDYKTRQSTKMVGESLEQYCHDEFNKIRMTAFPNAKFDKDNDARTGSKGDFIYREEDENGVEIISIMFEMKNEMETTATKHKNEDFFKELDKDRNEKKCEYAVLVSMLEADSELYNSGIVDVSYRYPKMYVVRPQNFIPMITLLRNAALNSLRYKNELAIMKNQNIDITNFENEVNTWKMSWANTMTKAAKKHSEAIEQINKAIKDLEKTRDALMTSDKHLEAAENKLDDLTVKRLTRGNPTMQKKFEDLKK